MTLKSSSEAARLPEDAGTTVHRMKVSLWFIASEMLADES